MPEVLTKHPDVSLQVLRSTGARCGDGAPQEILETCPAERFCKLPGGEICVYGLGDAQQMTQITASDWQALVQAAPPPRASDAAAFGEAIALSSNPVLAVATAIGLLLIGGAIGWVARRR